MRLLGALASGETLQANESSDALTALNDMLGIWSTENLLIVSKAIEPFPLVAGQASYTMGIGGNFNTARPQKIENALLRTTTASTTFDLPIDIVNQDQWANISIKSVSSNIPTKLFAEGTYPLETIILWPVPAIANSLVLFSWKPLANISALNSVIDLPPGYAKALKYNLALELAPEYGRPLDELVMAQAVESKAAIKRMNVKPLYLTIDEAVLPHKPVFNWLTGE